MSEPNADYGRVTLDEAHAELMAFYDLCHPDASTFARGSVSFELRNALEACEALRLDLARQIDSSEAGQ